MAHMTTCACGQPAAIITAFGIPLCEATARLVGAAVRASALPAFADNIVLPVNRTDEVA